MTRWKESDLLKMKAKVRQEPYQVYVGIDCGVNTGFAAWSRTDKRFLQLDTVQIHIALSRVYNSSLSYRLFVRVEDARLRKWIPKQANESRERGRREGAGSVKRDAKIWEDFLTYHAIPFELVAPKDNKTKYTAAEFKRLTGFSGSTNEHGRDAAMLVYNF